MLVLDHESIPLIKSAIAQGQSVEMTVNGRSMMPFIRGGDIVELAPPDTEVHVGSIVLAELPEEYYPLHRIVARIDENQWLVRGDCKKYPDGQISSDNIIGVVRQIKRKSRRVSLPLGRTGALIGWFSAHGILFPIARILLFIRRLLT